MKVIVALLIFSSLSTGVKPKCSALEDGGYLMRLTSDQSSRDCNLRISQGIVSAEIGSEIVLSRILKNDKCRFIIDLWKRSNSAVNEKASGRSALFLADIRGDRQLELERTSGDTTFFSITYIGMPGATGGWGDLVRLP